MSAGIHLFMQHLFIRQFLCDKLSLERPSQVTAGADVNKQTNKKLLLHVTAALQ